MKWLILLLASVTLQTQFVTLQAQDEHFRKEWSDFKGFYGPSIPSALTTGEVSESSNVYLDNDVLETFPGTTLFSTPTFSSAGIPYAFVAYEKGLTVTSAKRSILYYWSNFLNWDEITRTSDNDYATNELVHGESTASVSGTGVVGGLTQWHTHVQPDDDWKCNADADSSYTNISAVNSSASLTLGSSYTGGCATGATYSIRKNISVTGRYSGSGGIADGSVLNGWALLITSQENPVIYDGTNLFNMPSIATVAVVTTHKNRWFVANSQANPNRVWWSPVNSTGAWNSTAFEDVQNGHQEIVRLVSEDSNLLVFSRYGKIHRIFGEFDTAVGRPTRIEEVLVNFSIGQIGARTIIRYNNAIWFVSSTGLYALIGNELKLMGRNFESLIKTRGSPYLNGASLFAPGNEYQSFAGVDENKLFINFRDFVGVIDTKGNTIIKDSTMIYGGGFANFNDRFITGIADSDSGSGAPFRILRFNTPGIYSDLTSNTSTAPINISYISDSYCGEAAEHKKEFKDLYVLYEQDVSSNIVQSNQHLFDYVVDDSGPYIVNYSTITFNGTQGRIALHTFPVGATGNCLKWRLRGNNNTRNSKILKIVLRGKHLNLR